MYTAPRIPIQGPFSPPIYQIVDINHPLAFGLKWAWLTPQTPTRAGIVYNSVPNSGGVTESSGGLQKMTYNNGTHLPESRFGYVWNFNGSGSTPLQMFDTNTACSLLYNLKRGGTQRMTVSAWIKNPPKNTAFAYMGPNNTSFRTWDLYCQVTTGVARFSVNGSSIFDAIGSTDLTTGKWFLVTGVFTGTEVKVYVNGVLEATTAFSGTIADSGGGPLIASWPLNSQIMTGLMASVMYWNRALSGAEIGQLYSDPFAIFTPPSKTTIPSAAFTALAQFAGVNLEHFLGLSKTAAINAEHRTNLLTISQQAGINFEHLSALATIGSQLSINVEHIQRLFINGAINVEHVASGGVVQTAGINVERLQRLFPTAAINVEHLGPNAGTSVSLAQVRFTGDLRSDRPVDYQVGDETASRLIARQPVTGREVARIETEWDATTHPIESVVQNRVATTDATVTTLETIAIPSNTAVHIEAVVVAIRTGGAAGAAQDSAGYVIHATLKNVGGTATLVGTVVQVAVQEDQVAWDASIDVNSGNARVRVTGAVNNNVTWHSTVRTWSVNF